MKRAFLQTAFVFSSLLLSAPIHGCGGGSGLTFFVTFKDANLLQSGQPVLYKGVRVGDVQAVDIEPAGGVKVTVNGYREYEASLYREAGFKIEELQNQSGDQSGRCLVVYDRGSTRTPIQGGEIFEGTETEVGSWFDKLSDAGKRAWDGLTGVAAAGWESARDYLASPEGEAFLKNLDEYAQKAKDIGREQFEKFKQETLPELEERAARLREKMERDGNIDGAKRFWDGFMQWLDDQRKAQ